MHRLCRLEAGREIGDEFLLLSERFVVNLWLVQAGSILMWVARKNVFQGE